MCGIAGVVGTPEARRWLDALVHQQRHRGPDAHDVRTFAGGRAGLGSDRLRIVGLDPAGDGVLSTQDGRWHLAFNGEVYNHVELRRALEDRHRFRTSTDTEVVLAAWARWGPACLHRFVGMFALLVWDEHEQCLHAARDRFGVKPLHHARTPDGAVVVASEVAALLDAGVRTTPDEAAWATYLATGAPGAAGGTFWTDVHAVEAGQHVRWDDGGPAQVERWYDLVHAVGPDLDERDDEEVQDDVVQLLSESVALRFRADVPVGVALSSGLDSSSLLGLVDRLPGAAPSAAAYTFATGDPRYDEHEAVAALLAGTDHALRVCTLAAAEVPALAADVHAHLRQPFGGVPTLAYARLFEQARADGVPVVLDGQGLDEAWAGYDYHATAHEGGPVPVVQGTAGGGAVRPDCLTADLRATLAPMPTPAPTPPSRFPDALREVQRRDLLETKLPRALRYNDGVSMRASVELREPFLDHRLVELALRQPPHRTVGDGEGKALLRRLAPRLRPPGAPTPAPKQAVQTPQREWLRGPLSSWADGRIDAALQRWGGSWLDPDAVRTAWGRFLDGEGDNAHFVWQWVSLGMEAEVPVRAPLARR